MTMKEAVVNVFSNYANFNGRARRAEYWYFVLFNLAVALGLGIVTGILPFLGFLGGLYTLATLVPGVAVAVRRLHDTGRSGWLYLVILVPLVGGILLIIWLATEGYRGTNQYGPDPKAEPWETETRHWEPTPPPARPVHREPETRRTSSEEAPRRSNHFKNDNDL